MVTVTKRTSSQSLYKNVLQHLAISAGETETFIPLGK